MKWNEVVGSEREKEARTINTDKVVVGSWWDRETLGELVGSEVDSELYDGFKEWLDGSEYSEACDSLLVEYWEEFANYSKSVDTEEEIAQEVEEAVGGEGGEEVVPPVSEEPPIE